MSSAKIVVDLGFGDSGKGLAVDHIAAQDPDTSLVVRFSGGHQAGHTVVRDGRRHTFSNFGAGTLVGVPTYYSADTTLFPPAALMERADLGSIRPELVIHPLAMITTPYDVAYNRATERVNKHGSCGVGFGATVERHQQGVVLYAKDLLSSWVVEQRMRSVDAYYRHKVSVADSNVKRAYEEETSEFNVGGFVSICRTFVDSDEVAVAANGVLQSERPNLIFEGSQGIMLDQLHGLFPHVTRSDTTSKGALAILRALGWNDPVDIYYISRCYQTRHGNGPMSSTSSVTLHNNRDEANVHNDYQGRFRVGELDLELLNCALRTDAVYHDGIDVRKHLVVTCLDQRPDFNLALALDGIDADFKSVSTSYGPDADSVKTVELTC